MTHGVPERTRYQSRSAGGETDSLDPSGEHGERRENASAYDAVHDGPHPVAAQERAQGQDGQGESKKEARKHSSCRRSRAGAARISSRLAQEVDGGYPPGSEGRQDRSRHAGRPRHGKRERCSQRSHVEGW